MKARDILKQGVMNLLRHKGRSMLTVSGVIVGCCSVVIMISIGIGMRLSTQQTLEQMGDLTMITVETVSSGTNAKLDDNAVAQLKTLDHVAAVIPKINSQVNCKVVAGADNRYVNEGVGILGEDLVNAHIEGMELVEGDWDSLQKGEVLVGQYLDYSFRDSRRPEGYDTIYRYNYYDWETGSFREDLPAPYVDLNKDTVTLILGSDEESGKQVSMELKIGGVLKEDWNKGYETSEGIIMDIATWRKLMDEYAKLTGGKKSEETGYSTIKVKADDISHVESLEKEIRKLGFTTYSMESIRKPMEQDVQQKQMLLGGVGAVALFVAALGIANTMIMAISERIGEIGVMKALGCYLKDIRKMFLLEAGCIGLIGGIAGIVLSYGISILMNNAGAGAIFGDSYVEASDAASMAVSVIPWWLAIFAVLFSILIGVCAGFYPAEKAVRIPALEAIRHE